MATPNVQSFIQPIAQNNTPFTANNGNPGTVYNMPNTGSYKPPMASAQNQWALNPSAGMYTNDQFWLNAGAGQPAAGGGGSPFFNNPGLTTIPGSVIVQPPTTGGGSFPPSNDGNTPNGGAVNPDVYTGVSPGTGTSVGNVFNPGPLGNVVSNVGTSGSNYTHTLPTKPNGSVDWSGGVKGILGSLGQALGTRDGGGMDWQQALDLFLPGDLYNSETGRWNAGNALVTAANAVNPVIGAIVRLAIDNGIGTDAMRQRIINDGLAQFDVDLRRTVDDVAAQTQGIMENRTNQTMLDRANANNNAFMPGGSGWIGLGGAGQLGSSPFDSAANGNILDRMESWGTNTAPVRDSRSGTSTGSGVVWSAENGGNFAGGSERAWANWLDSFKNQKPGSDVRQIQ